eukprot:TRINITY_DN38888_c0_g1_i1.p1 TRINITY_DN38888_c0_g1~~TRINITY_DN38888_c0_g1_i1.p1  ORF type:complete len:231 (+),score=52.61 TRINITY_DN38888_c0_g1_i1:53-694(+)
MEMLAEMEGSEEALMELNNAEHKPEDEMQTDEWMYELKHRKSWATGMYVPSGENGEEEKLTLDSKNLENDGRAPSSWQEHLSTEQVDCVIKSWEKIPKDGFGKVMHERLLKMRKNTESTLDSEEQAKQIVATVDVAVKQILNVANIDTVAASLNLRVQEYNLPADEALLIFGEALLASVAATAADFSPEEREAWGCAYRVIAGLIVDLESEKE